MLHISDIPKNNYISLNILQIALIFWRNSIPLNKIEMSISYKCQSSVTVNCVFKYVTWKFSHQVAQSKTNYHMHNLYFFSIKSIIKKRQFPIAPQDEANYVLDARSFQINFTALKDSCACLRCRGFFFLRATENNFTFHVRSSRNDHVWAVRRNYHYLHKVYTVRFISMNIFYFFFQITAEGADKKNFSIRSP